MIFILFLQEGSTLIIPVNKGFFGIEYLEDISLIVNKQIDDTGL